jgi:hypothetical protein
VSVAVPIYGWVQGDSVILVVLAREEQTVAELTDQLCRAASVRVAETGAAYAMRAGQRLDPNALLHSAGIGALDRIDVLFQ